jgi:predicted dehydrogenase
LEAGVIGRVCFARARASNPGPDRIPDFLTDPTWFHKAGAGPLYDLAVYPLHVLTGLLGPVKRVTAFSGIAIPHRFVAQGPAHGQTIEVEADDNTHLLLDFGNATFAYVDATYCVLSSKGPRVEFYGERGVMNLASTASDPPVEIFRAEASSGLRGWVTPEPSTSRRLLLTLTSLPPW